VKLSVCLITYNHERYLARALDGVLAQNVDFDFEVVVGEDHSTDNTRDVLAGYVRRHPTLIRLLPATVNLGVMRNFLRTFSACTGQYVALLEGDDYWTDPDKLRRQVAFLDAHPAHTMCGHPVARLDEDGRDLGSYPELTRRDLTLEDLQVENVLPTCSVVLRGGLVRPFPDWLATCFNGDWPLFLLHARHGPVHVLPDVMGVYRVHGGGVWSSLSQLRRFEELVRTFELARQHFGEPYESHFLAALGSFRFEIAWLAAGQGDRARACSELRTLLARPGLRRRISPARFAALGLTICSPALAAALNGVRKRLTGVATPSG
jgi:glycosyltransferase involved in cell wall biosynthesis